MLHVILYLSLYFGGLIGSLRNYAALAFVSYQTTYFFNPKGRWWAYSIPDLSYSFYAVLFMAGLMLIKNKETKLNQIRKAPPLLWMFFIVSLYSLISISAIVPEIHSIQLEYFINTAVTMVIAYKLCSNLKHLHIYLIGYLTTATYLSFYVFQIGRNSGDRVERIPLVDAPDSNGLASALAPALAFSFYYFWQASSNKVRFVVAVSGTLILNAIILINSRGAFLGIFIGLTYIFVRLYFANKKNKKNKQKFYLIALLVMGLTGAVSIMDSGFIDRMLTLKEETTVNKEAESGATRTIFWKAAWEMTKDYPFGDGFRGFNYKAHLYMPQDAHTGKTLNRTVHSTWFEALTEIGYIGALAFILMLLSSFKLTKRIRNKAIRIGDRAMYNLSISLEGSLIIFIITMTFLNRMRGEVLYWCILFICCAYNIYIIKQEKEKEGKKIEK